MTGDVSYREEVVKPSFSIYKNVNGASSRIRLAPSVKTPKALLNVEGGVLK